MEGSKVMTVTVRPPDAKPTLHVLTATSVGGRGWIIAEAKGNFPSVVDMRESQAAKPTPLSDSEAPIASYAGLGGIT